MRFCDLFVEYKINLKEIKSTIPFTKLPLYRKIFIVVLFACTVLSGIMMLVGLRWFSFIPLLIGVCALIIFLIIDSTKNNLKIMLKSHYIPYSERRMEMMLKLLQEHKIDIDNAEALDSLIEEAKIEQLKSDYIAPIKNPLGYCVQLYFQLLFI